MAGPEGLQHQPGAQAEALPEVEPAPPFGQPAGQQFIFIDEFQAKGLLDGILVRGLGSQNLPLHFVQRWSRIIIVVK